MAYNCVSVSDWCFSLVFSQWVLKPDAVYHHAIRVVQCEAGTVAEARHHSIYFTSAQSVP